MDASGFGWTLLALVACVACGPGGPEAEVPIAREQPSDQIFRVGKVWEARSVENGFRTPPSPIATFSTEIASTITFQDDARTAKEAFSHKSTLKLSDGRTFACESKAEVTATVRFANRSGEEPAVEIARPALRLSRRCSPSGFPEPVLEVPATVSRFALRGDRLVGFAPASERREYIPAQ